MNPLKTHEISQEAEEKLENIGFKVIGKHAIKHYTSFSLVLYAKEDGKLYPAAQERDADLDCVFLEDDCVDIEWVIKFDSLFKPYVIP